MNALDTLGKLIGFLGKLKSTCTNLNIEFVKCVPFNTSQGLKVKYRLILYVTAKMDSSAGIDQNITVPLCSYL